MGKTKYAEVQVNFRFAVEDEADEVDAATAIGAFLHEYNDDMPEWAIRDDGVYVYWEDDETGEVVMDE
jgi:predicted DNA-binding ArsR family transcriptional regulator